jgi:gamma-glutamyltranspeptidase/glutathione hydrolase
MSARAVATASEAHVAEAATALLTKGNAVDAVIAGVFAAAAVSPSVLFGPVQILTGGAGLGLRAIDGRTQQPGRGVARPRGFQPGDPIPPAARVGVPGLPAALASTLATSGASTLSQAMAPAIALADDERKKLLRRISQRGPAALAEESVAAELVHAAGRLAGGILTREDLDQLRPTVLPCDVHALRGKSRRAAVVPWRADAILKGGDTLDGRRVQVVAAADFKGLLAIACYEVHHEGLSIPELGIVAPFTATPVLRGETRVRPGEPCLAAAPLAIADHQSVLDLALGAIGAADGERALGAALHKLSEGDPMDPSVMGIFGEGETTPLTDGTLLGVLRSRTGATLLRTARLI